jgi:hypothetical protein
MSSASSSFSYSGWRRTIRNGLMNHVSAAPPAPAHVCVVVDAQRPATQIGDHPEQQIHHQQHHGVLKAHAPSRAEQPPVLVQEHHLRCKHREDRAGCADGEGALVAQQRAQHRAGQPAQHIHQPEAHMAEEALKLATDGIQRQHVEDQVQRVGRHDRARRAATSRRAGTSR